MRAALWFLGLFGVAVAVALFAGNNQSTVTVFWPPYRLDLSLNLVLLVAVAVFMLVWLAMRALQGLMALPKEARRWRIQHQERQIQNGLLDAMAHLAAGRFIRARKTAERILNLEHQLATVEDILGDAAYARRAARLRTMLHLLAADSAHALQDQAQRDAHAQQAVAQAALPELQDMREAVQLTAVRWAVQDRNLPLAQQRYDELPQGVARRTVALRWRFKIARFANRQGQALDVARLLGKHRAFSSAGTHSLLRSLAIEYLLGARDSAAVIQHWNKLDEAEQAMPEVAVTAARQFIQYGGEPRQALAWLLPIWEHILAEGPARERVNLALLVDVLTLAFARQGSTPEAVWLKRIEQAHLQHAADELLQYLAGVACFHAQLWGKAQQLIEQALPRLTRPDLKRQAWITLARLAEHRDDASAAARAWREAALL